MSNKYFLLVINITVSLNHYLLIINLLSTILLAIKFYDSKKHYCVQNIITFIVNCSMLVINITVSIKHYCY